MLPSDSPPSRGCEKRRRSGGSSRIVVAGISSLDTANLRGLRHGKGESRVLPPPSGSLAPKGRDGAGCGVGCC